MGAGLTLKIAIPPTGIGVRGELGCFERERREKREEREGKGEGGGRGGKETEEREGERGKV